MNTNKTNTITITVTATTEAGEPITRLRTLPTKSFDLLLAAASVGLEGFEGDNTEEELDAAWSAVFDLSFWDEEGVN